MLELKSLREQQKIIGRSIYRTIHYIEIEELKQEDNLIFINSIPFLINNDVQIIDENAMILILSKDYFNYILSSKNINDDNVIEKIDLAFISINDSTSKYSYFKKDHKNVITLKFDDLIEPLFDYVLFNKDHAKILLEFIERNKDKKFIIHCEAGISRSGAIGQFINDTYKKMDESKFKELNKHISPNQLVYNTLKNMYNEKI